MSCVWLVVTTGAVFVTVAAAGAAWGWWLTKRGFVPMYEHPMTQTNRIELDDVEATRFFAVMAISLLVGVMLGFGLGWLAFTCSL